MIPCLLSVLSIILSLTLSAQAGSLNLNRVTASAPWSSRQEHGIQVYPRSLTFERATDASLVTWQPGFLMLWGGIESSGRAANDAWVSSDSGTTWQVISGSQSRYSTHRLSDGSRTGHCANPSTGEIYVTGGSRSGNLTNQMWYSPNGTHWFQQANGLFWNRERGPCTVDRQGKVYVVGGLSGRTTAPAPANDVWIGQPTSTSNRTLTWTMQTLRAPFYARQGHQLESYYSEYLQRNILYMANGFTTGARYNDIWISADDATSWQRLNAAAPYEPRMDTHLSIMKNGVMLTAGGDCGGTCNKNDVWASVDGGYTWGECCANCGFTIREDHVQIVDSSGRFSVMGGSQENQPNPDNNGLANDIWRSSISLHDAAEVIKACNLPAPRCNAVGITCLPDGFCPCHPHGKQMTMSVIQNNPGWSPRFEGGVGTYPKALKFNHADTGASITLPAGAIIMWAGRQNYTGATLNDVWATSTGQEWFLIGGRANFDGMQARSAGRAIDDMQRSSDCSDAKTGRIYSVGGMTKDGMSHTSSVQVSTDAGMSWQKLNDAPWAKREAAACSVDSKGRLFIYGGHYKDANDQTVRLNDVWMSSTYGQTWSRQTANAPWSARTQLDGEIWNSPSLKLDVIYMANGIGSNPQNPTGRFNDVWVSSNAGVGWTRLTENAPFMGRQDGEMLVSDSGIVVVVGGDTGQNLPGNVNDIFASLDGGITWGLCNISAGFYPREDHVATFTAGGYLLVTQGEAPQTTMDNKVWISTENFNNVDEIAAVCGVKVPARGVGLRCWPGRSCPRPDPEDESSTGGNDDDDDDGESSSTGRGSVASENSSTLSTTMIVLIVAVVVFVIVVAYFLRRHMQTKPANTDQFAPADHQLTQILTQHSTSDAGARM